MQNQNNVSLNEEERLTDLLSSQKFLTGVYNTYCCESATSAVKSCLTSILEDEHRIQGEIFGEMQSRNLYTVEKAEEAKISSTKQKFSASVTH